MRWCACALVLASACSPLSRLVVSQPVGERYSVRSDGLIDADIGRVQAAIEHASEGLARWGGLPQPVTVYVVNTHEELERAVHRRGYDWLRAWASYDEVILQAPSSWRAGDETLDQLVLHELTHCLLFQRSGTRETWAGKQVPLWFREGMAIANAGQQRQYPTLEDTAQWLSRHPERDVFADGEALSRDFPAEVYAFSLHAWRFHEDRFGLERLQPVLEQMRAGESFAHAFGAALGLPLENFQRDFLVFLKLRAFRSIGRPPLRPDTKLLPLRAPPGD